MTVRNQEYMRKLQLHLCACVTAFFLNDTGKCHILYVGIVYNGISILT